MSDNATHDNMTLNAISNFGKSNARGSVEDCGDGGAALPSGRIELRSLLRRIFSLAPG
jgi:hypothetical protein